jgi:hypothetical protein
VGTLAVAACFSACSLSPWSREKTAPPPSPTLTRMGDTAYRIDLEGLKRTSRQGVITDLLSRAAAVTHLSRSRPVDRLSSLPPGSPKGTSGPSCSRSSAGRCPRTTLSPSTPGSGPANGKKEDGFPPPTGPGKGKEAGTPAI